MIMRFGVLVFIEFIFIEVLCYYCFLLRNNIIGMYFWVSVLSQFCVHLYDFQTLFFRAFFATFSRYQTPLRFIRYAVVAASNLVKDSAQIAQEDLDLDATFKVFSAPVHFSFNFPVCL